MPWRTAHPAVARRTACPVQPWRAAGPAPCLPLLLLSLLQRQHVLWVQDAVLHLQAAHACRQQEPNKLLHGWHMAAAQHSHRPDSCRLHLQLQAHRLSWLQLPCTGAELQLYLSNCLHVLITWARACCACQAAVRPTTAVCPCGVRAVIGGNAHSVGRGRLLLQLLLQVQDLLVLLLPSFPAERERQAGGVGHDNAVVLRDTDVRMMYRQPVAESSKRHRAAATSDQIRPPPHTSVAQLHHHPPAAQLADHPAGRPPTHPAAAYLCLLSDTLGEDTKTSTCTYSALQLQQPGCCLCAAATAWPPLLCRQPPVQLLQAVLLLLTHMSSRCAPSQLPVTVTVALHDARGSSQP